MGVGEIKKIAVVWAGHGQEFSGFNTDLILTHLSSEMADVKLTTQDQRSEQGSASGDLPPRRYA